MRETPPAPRSDVPLVSLGRPALHSEPGSLTQSGPGPRDWDLLGVGDIDIDIFLKVDRLPARDDKVMSSLLGEFPGGMTANVCCAASRLGARCAMVGLIGDDPNGAKALAGLTAYGVDTSLVRILEGGRTFFCVVLLDGSGEKALTAVDTDCRLPRRDIDPEVFARARAVHILGDDAPFVEWAAEEAGRRGALVSVDMEASTTQRGVPALESLMARVDVVFLNEHGYRLGFGDEPIDALRRVLGLGPRVAVITRGALGALVGTANGVWEIPAYQVPVADSTGAGDCFVGAFLTSLLRGASPPECGRFAAAAAALSLREVGARTALPDRAEILALLAGSATTHHWRIAQ